MSRNSKGSKNKELQISTANDAEMKVPNLTRTKNGSYSFRMVIPPDVRCALFPQEPGKKNIWESLGKDRKAAVLRAEELNAYWHRRIDEERKRLQGKTSEAVLSAAEESNIQEYIFNLQGKPLSSLSEEEVRMLILNNFIRSEIGCAKEREKFILMDEEDGESLSGFTRQQMIQSYSGELKLLMARPGIYKPNPEETDHYERISKNEFLNYPHYGMQGFFQKYGYYIDSKVEEDFLCSAAAYYLRSVQESRKRTLAALKGEDWNSFDSEFPSYKEIKEIKNGEFRREEAIDGVTIETLCDEVKKSKIEKGVSSATTKHLQTVSKIMKDFFGAETPIKSIDRDKGKEFVKFLKTVPNLAGLRYPGMNIVKAARKESKKSKPSVISTKTAIMHFEYTIGMFKQVEDHRGVQKSSLGQL